MRIGILTMVYEYNYGGILQCIALQNILKEMGHNVEVIKYVPTKKSGIIHKIKQLLFSLSFLELLELVKGIMPILIFRENPKYDFKNLLLRNNSFIKNNINYTEECNEDNIGLMIMEHCYDVVIVGSDKIWGGIGQEKLVYFGDWHPKYKGILVSYAACSSRDKIPVYNRNKLKTLLNRFSYISVRDSHTRELIRPLTTKEVIIVNDPTFLYNYDFHSSRYRFESYLLTYILGSEIKGGFKTIISQMKETYKVQNVVAIILPNHPIDVLKYTNHVIFDATPDEWIDLIKNANAILTDSFHGMVFSLKFRKQFVGYYTEKSRSTRILELKNKYDLDAIISCTSDFKQIGKEKWSCKYSKINSIIEKENSKSLTFLNNSLIDY